MTIEACNEPPPEDPIAIPEDSTDPVACWLRGESLRDLPPEAEATVRQLCLDAIETIGATITTLAHTCRRYEIHSEYLNDAIIQSPWHSACARGEAFGLSTAAMFLGHLHNWMMMRRQRTMIDGGRDAR